MTWVKDNEAKPSKYAEPLLKHRQNSISKQNIAVKLLEADVNAFSSAGQECVIGEIYSEASTTIANGL